MTETYSPKAVERAMKVQEIMLRAMSGQILWIQAADILGISARQMRRWKCRYEHRGYDGLFDRRKRTPSPRRVPLATVEQILHLYREKYYDFNARHFCEKLMVEMPTGVTACYTRPIFPAREQDPLPDLRRTSSSGTDTAARAHCRCARYPAGVRE